VDITMFADTFEIVTLNLKRWHV